MTKRISETYLLEIEQWPSEVLQKHQSSMIYSFIFIHSVMSEIDKNEHSMYCGFLRIARFHIWNFENDKSLGRKVLFFKLLGQQNFLEFSHFLFIFILSFLWTFQNNLNYASIKNIREVIKLCNQGDKSFETDFDFTYDPSAKNVGKMVDFDTLYL